jgi:hypothetical protein
MRALGSPRSSGTQHGMCWRLTVRVTVSHREQVKAVMKSCVITQPNQPTNDTVRQQMLYSIECVCMQDRYLHHTSVKPVTQSVTQFFSLIHDITRHLFTLVSATRSRYFFVYTPTRSHASHSSSVSATGKYLTLHTQLPNHFKNGLLRCTFDVYSEGRILLLLPSCECITKFDIVHHNCKILSPMNA